MIQTFANPSLAPMYEGPDGVALTVNQPIGTDDHTWIIGKSDALGKSLIVSTDPGNVRRIYCRVDASLASDDLWLHVYNSTTLPADGAVTTLILPRKKIHAQNTDTTFEVDLGLQGQHFSNGLTLCVSTTEFTKTLIGSDVCSFEAEYITS